MQAGDLIDDRYRLLQPIGEGGFGAVWLAEETSLGRHVAIKFIEGALDHDDMVRFRREIQALGRLNHDHVLKLFRNGETAGQPYIVTELVHGETLRPWSEPGRSIEEILSVATQITSALAAAHREGIVHRDLKPPNVMVMDRGGAPFVKVLDFGIAKLAGPAQPDITKTGDVLGTPGFMSPEQLRGASDIGPATDLYNLGVILWELIEGRPMFPGSTALEISMQHLVEPPPPLTRPLPEFFGRLIFQFLQKDPTHRGSAAVAHRILTERQWPQVAPPPIQEQPAPVSAARLGWIAGGLCALVALLGGVLWQLKSDATDPAPVTTKVRGRVDSLNRATPPPTPEPRRTAAPDDRRVPQKFSSPGCSRSWEPGTHTARQVSHAVPEWVADSLVHVPQNYAPAGARPLVVFLSDGEQLPADAMNEAQGLVDAATEDGAVLVFVEGRSLDGNRPSSFPWSRDDVGISNLDYVEELVRVIKDRFCIDARRVFLVGDGRGGRAAEVVLSRSNTYSAVATTDYRRKGLHHHSEDTGEEFELDGRPPIPHLLISGADSPARPHDDRRTDCHTKFVLTPLSKQRDEMREHHGCSGPATTVPTSDGATCETWTCDVPFVSCVTDQGQHWPGYRGEVGACDQVSEYEFGKEIWEFFTSKVPPPNPSGGCGFDPVPVADLELATKNDDLSNATDLAGRVILPVDYRNEMPHGLIVAFSEGGQSPAMMATMMKRLLEIADRERVVVLIPKGRSGPATDNITRRPWLQPKPALKRLLEDEDSLPELLHTVHEDIDASLRSLCIDQDRMFTLGYGSGGLAALRLQEQTKKFSAIATSGYRHAEGEPLPDTATAPYLFLAPNDSPKLPHDGRQDERVIGHEGKTCNSSPDLTLDAQIEEMRKLHRCSGRPRTYATESAGASCKSWSCDVAYVSCRVDGDRQWPGFPREDECFGPEATFQYADEIWRFFDTHHHRKHWNR